MYPKEYVDYLVHFHGDRDYFECHEILEEYWKEIDRNNKESVWVGLIQLAVGSYHHRRENFKGAIKTYQKALDIISKEKTLIHKLGIDSEDVIKLLKNQISAADSGNPYRSINIPISDPSLLNTCKSVCTEKGFNWGEESNLLDEQLIHRHSRRDRSDVINERLKALNKKK